MHDRIEYLQHESDPDWKQKIEEERERIRQENITALNYSIMWLGLVSVVFALAAQLFTSNNDSHLFFLLIYIETLFFLVSPKY